MTAANPTANSKFGVCNDFRPATSDFSLSALDVLIIIILADVLRGASSRDSNPVYDSLTE